MSEDRAAVLVGVSQLSQRDAEPAEALDPVSMCEIVSRGCLEDARAGDGPLRDLDTLALVCPIGWRSRNAPRLVAERLGAKPRREFLTVMGGEMGVTLLNHVARSIERGESRVALVLGTNNLRTRLAARVQGVSLDWPHGGEGEPTLVGEDRAGTSEREQAVGLAAPTSIYPIFENALRAHRGLDLETHRRRMGALFQRFSDVAARNPHAWFPTSRSADELTTVTPENRMIAFPYPKYLNAVIRTDQAAGLLLMSGEAARAHGIPEERWVHWWGGAEAREAAWLASERPDFHSCEALTVATRRALAEAGTPLGELATLDLYSCFPSAVEMALEMLDLAPDDPRGFTVTGGLPYAGGPGNSYTLHALAATVERLRAEPGAKGLVTGNGWYLTKHSAAVLASRPRETRGDPEPEAPRRAPVEVLDAASGEATIETYTVLYARDGAPERGVIVGCDREGRRFLANTPADRALLEDLVSREAVGLPGRVTSEDGSNRFRPS